MAAVPQGSSKGPPDNNEEQDREAVKTACQELLALFPASELPSELLKEIKIMIQTMCAKLSLCSVTPADVLAEFCVLTEAIKTNNRDLAREVTKRIGEQLRKSKCTVQGEICKREDGRKDSTCTMAICEGSPATPGDEHHKKHSK